MTEPNSDLELISSCFKFSNHDEPQEETDFRRDEEVDKEIDFRRDAVGEWSTEGAESSMCVSDPCQVPERASLRVGSLAR